MSGAVDLIGSDCRRREAIAHVAASPRTRDRAIVLLVVIGGWFIDAQRVPEFRDCDTTATLARRQRCAGTEYAKIQPAVIGWAGRAGAWETTPVAEAPMRKSKNGLVVDCEGWFIINARESRWKDEGPLGSYCTFEGKRRFPHFGDQHQRAGAR